MIDKDYSLNYHVSYRNTKKSFIKKLFFWLVLSFFLVAVGLLVKNIFLDHKSTNEFISKDIISPLAKGSQAVLAVTETLMSQSDGLKNIVDEALLGTTADYGVAIINLKTGEEYFLNEHKKFDSASLYKLWVMVTVYEWIDEEKLTLDKVLTQEVKTLNERFKIDEETAEKKEGTISLSVKDALELMITKSDNYSALLLALTIRLSQVQLFLDEYGFADSKVGGAESLPMTTASDIAMFFTKLYKGELGSPQNTSEMITLLKRQVLNEKLPKNLPENTVIAHKTGELGGVSHDSGIVYSPSGEYIIVVLSDSTNPKEANERIVNLSKAVYDYFNP